MFGFNAEAQNSTSKTKIACYTLSCCGIGPIGIEIWGVKRCYYVYTEGKTAMHSIEFESNEKVDNLIFENDVVLPNTFDSEGNAFIIPKGTYSVNNNTFSFPQSKVKIKKICLEETNTGVLFGHEYSYSITICAYYLGWGKTSSFVITPKFNTEELSKVLNSGGIIEFKDDKVLKFENFSYILNKGKYLVNEDGNIYIENAKIN